MCIILCILYICTVSDFLHVFYYMTHIIIDRIFYSVSQIIERSSKVYTLYNLLYKLNEEMIICLGNRKKLSFIWEFRQKRKESACGRGE